MPTLPERWYPCLDVLEQTVCNRFAVAIGLSQTYVRASEIILIVNTLNTWPSAAAHTQSLIKVYLFELDVIEIDDRPVLVYLVNRDWMALLYAYLLTISPPPSPRSCRQATFTPGAG